MSTIKNDPIGEVVCSHRDCDQVCKVFRFQSRSDRGSMFKGKVYADCPTHGRIGADGKPATQEYILENATIWGASGKPVEPEKEPEKPAPSPAAKPEQKPAQPAQAAKKSAPEPVSKPVAQPEPKADKWGPLIQ